MHQFRTVLTACTLIGLIGLPGCRRVVIVHSEPTPPPPPVVIETYPDLTGRQIQAAGAMKFESSRLERLTSLAQRQDLSPHAQALLVETAAHQLEFESSRLSVFNTLIDNPTLSDQGRTAILSHIDDLQFEASRLQVLDKLDRQR